MPSAGLTDLVGTPDQWVNGFSYAQWVAGGYAPGKRCVGQPTYNPRGGGTGGGQVILNPPYLIGEGGGTAGKPTFTYPPTYLHGPPGLSRLWITCFGGGYASGSALFGRDNTRWLISRRRGRGWDGGLHSDHGSDLGLCGWRGRGWDGRR